MHTHRSWLDSWLSRFSSQDLEDGTSSVEFSGFKLNPLTLYTRFRNPDIGSCKDLEVGVSGVRLAEGSWFRVADAFTVQILSRHSEGNEDS